MELILLSLKKPLHALVICLALATLANSTRIVLVEKAVAVVETQQVTDAMMNEKQLEMFELLIRIDENVKTMKEQM